MPSTFQSYIVIGNSPQKIREKTIGIAKSQDIDLAKTSPDIFVIAPEKNSITIDQIRNLKSHIFQKPFKEKVKFIIIENAHLATTAAQNALLKIFEEPPSQAIIILESASKESLLLTIVSRAVLIKAQTDMPKEQEIIATLDLKTALTKITEIDDHKQFLDNQIISLTALLVKNIRANPSTFSSAQISNIIERHMEAKQMITANVNPTFVLTNLILSTNLASK